MIIHYVINAWGHYMVVYYDKCCDTMAIKYNPEVRPHDGFWFDTVDGQLMEYHGGKIVGRVFSCWFCHKEIKTIQRELEPLLNE